MLKSFPNCPIILLIFYFCIVVVHHSKCYKLVILVMCYRPLHLLNTSLHFNCKCDKMYMQVPCGKCGECRTMLQNSFEARVYYEYLETETLGGYTLFQSFSYNQEHVPSKFGIYVFSARHYRLFTQNFRHELERAGFSNSDVKLIWTCEYGGEKFRPHYHALFFVRNASLTPVQLCNMLEAAWSQKVHVHKNEWKNEPLGFLDTNNPDPRRRSSIPSRIVNGQGALSYVSKYVCKDFDFYRMINGQVKHQKGVSAYIGPSLDRLSKEDKKEIFPFHRQSQGLGISMKDVIPIEDLVNGKCKIPDSNLGMKVVNLPQYIDRKVFYDYNPEDKCFRLNEKGLEMKRIRDDHNRDYVTKELKTLFTNSQNFLTNKFYKKYEYITCPSDFKIEIMQLMSGRKFSDLANYIINYKDRVDYFRDRDISDDLSMMLNLGSRVGSSVNFSLTSLKDSQSGLRRLQYLTCNTYKNRYEFRNFEEVLMLFNDLNSYYCELQQKNYIQRQVEKSRHKYLFHSLYR